MRKTVLLSITLLLGLQCAYSQDEVLIIDEDFQTWPATEEVISDPPADCESFNHIASLDKYDLVYETGGTGKVSLVKYLISPQCNTKRVNQGESASNAIDVTTGFIGLSKTEEETDTIGEMWLPRLTNVSSIEFGYSCTSSDRGVRLYTSTDNGETWEGPWDATGPGGELIGSDTKLGEMVELDINRDNVILKFTSGVDYDGVSQMTRIHNIKVWGVPGGHETGIAQKQSASIQASYVPGTGLMISGEVISVRVFDLQGRFITESYIAGDQVIDLENHPDGVYIVSAEDTSKEVFTRKIVKY